MKSQRNLQDSQMIREEFECCMQSGVGVAGQGLKQGYRAPKGLEQRVQSDLRAELVGFGAQVPSA